MATPQDPNLCILKILRPNLRDAIRRHLGITPPIDAIPGASAGDEPTGEKYPSNVVLNQAIADAIRTLNRRCGFHSLTQINVTVPSTSTKGPQLISIHGMGGALINGVDQSTINDIRRVLWQNTGAAVYTRLMPVSMYDQDRRGNVFDNFGASTPRNYFIEGYQIGLIPASSVGGTMQIWCGTGLIGFCDDVSTLDELPTDYQEVLEHIAVQKICMNHLDRPNAKEQFEIYSKLADQGVAEVQSWASTVLNEQLQHSLAFASRRRRRWA